MSFAAETTFLFLQSNFPDFQYFHIVRRITPNAQGDFIPKFIVFVAVVACYLLQAGRRNGDDIFTPLRNSQFVLTYYLFISVFECIVRYGQLDCFFGF